MSEIVDFSQCYSTGYASARARFRAAGAAVGGSLSSYTHPWAEAPSGAALSIDVCRIGDAKAPRQLLAISGTHGLEAAAGSAAQIGWLRSAGARALPADVSVLLVHSINPFGHAHTTRTTENNVDLNRNFLDFSEPLPGNTGFLSLAEGLVPVDWTPDALSQLQVRFDSFAAEHGPDALFDAMAKGQYSHPTGPAYGGAAPEWSNLTLIRIITEQMQAAEAVGLIDWHTGLGEYGDVFFLCFNEAGGALEAETARWWGPERILDQRPDGLARPSYSGLVFDGVNRALGNRPMAGAVVEFGTYAAHIREALLLDLWLKYRGSPDPETTAVLRSHLCDVFVPYSAPWRRKAVANGIRITQEAVDGLGSWSL